LSPWRCTLEQYADSALFRLLRDQYGEADADLRPRLPHYAWALDAWRGKFRHEEKYYNGISYDWFTINNALSLSPANPDDIPDIYIRLIFNTVETYLSRMDRFYFSQPRPFSLTPPNTVWAPQPPTPQQEAQKRASLDGATKFLWTDYERHQIGERLLRCTQDALLMGTGFAYVMEAQSPDPYPHALIKRLPPWDVLTDPLAELASEWRYAIVRQWFTVADAVKQWPKSKDAIEGAKQRGRSYGAPYAIQYSSTSGAYPRAEVQVLTFMGWYDKDALLSTQLVSESDLQDAGNPRLYKIKVLANYDGLIGEILEIVPLDGRTGGIPIIPLTFLKDSTEKSVRGYGFGQIAKDDTEELNALTEAMFLNLQYLLDPPGVYNAGMADQATRMLSGSMKPGQKTPVNLLPGQSITDVYQDREVRPLLEQIQAIRADVRQESNRKTSTTDMQLGLSPRTNTDTLGEVNLLKDESSEMFRYRLQRFDGPLKDILTKWAMFSALAVQAYETQTGNHLWARGDDGNLFPVDMSWCDEPWEMDIHAGTTYLDAAQQVGQVMNIVSTASQLDPQWANANLDRKKLFDFMLSPTGISPGKFELAPQEAQQMAQQAQMAQAQQQQVELAKQRRVSISLTGQLPPQVAVPLAEGGTPPPEAGGQPPPEMAGPINPVDMSQMQAPPDAGGQPPFGGV
jgi:hypothetical protein